jgi:hypothetical protein
MLNDAVKKAGATASSHVGGLSGAFIPVSEDAVMIDAAADGAITFDKLEAMTCVGLDMIAVPGDTPVSTIAAIIADEAAIGMIARPRPCSWSRRPARKSATSSRSAVCSAARPSSRCIGNRAERSSRAAAALRRRCNR